MNIKRLIEEATIELLKTNSVDSLTVNMILDKSEVSKASFYRNFIDKYDLINHIFDDMIPQEIDHVGKTIKWSEFMLVLFDVFGKNRIFLREAFLSDDVNSLTNYAEAFFIKFILNIVTNSGGDTSIKTIKLASVLFGRSLTMYVKEWIIRGGQDTIYNMVRDLKDCVPYCIYNYIK